MDVTLDIRTVLAVLILIVAGVYLVAFFAMGLFFTEWGERVLQVLVVTVPLSVVGWAIWWLL